MNATDRPSFGALLRRHRHAVGLTQEELADRAEVSVRELAYLERDKHAARPGTIRRLGQALGLSEEAHATLLALVQEEVLDRTVAVRARASLPVSPTSFIGREREAAAIADLLRHETVRLLTLTGPGGTGKTRLAIQAAQGLLEAFHDGVVFVPLGALTDPALVASSVAAVLEVKEIPGHQLVEALRGYLREKRLLLLLDNFEHLLPAAPLVSELLAGCRHLKVLATSRAVLHLAAEHAYPVPTLAVPDPGRLPALGTLIQCEAVALFVERARAAKASFSLTGENAPAVVEICRRLNGLPLAIELAAARTRLFPPQTLLGRLGSRLEVLTGGARDLLPRQQTMRNTVAWSYELLTEQEQTLFRRLSIFVGGCIAQEAEAVCHGPSEMDSDVLAGLESLVDQSLLVVAEQQDGEPRFRMLETIREYALEQLEASGEAEDLRRRHAEAYLHLAEWAEQALVTTDDSAWWAPSFLTSSGWSLPADHFTWWEPFERERDNLFLALRWSVEREGAEDLAARLAGALARFWIERGYWNEGHWWTERVVPLCTVPQLVEAYPRACAQVFTAAACLSNWRCEFVTARRYGERSVDLWRLCRDTPGLVVALRALGQTAWQQGDRALARSLLEERAELSRKLGASQERIWALQDLGQMEIWEGNLQAARSILDGAVELAQTSGSTRNVIHLDALLADLACSQNDLVAARAFHEAALAQARVAFDPVNETISLLMALANAARRARRLGEYEQAIALCEEYVSLVRAKSGADRERGTAWGLNHLADGLRCQGDHVRATALYEESLALFRQQGNRQAIAAVLHNLGHEALSQSNVKRARALFMESLSLFQELKFTSSIADCVAGLASVLAHEGDLERAALLFGAAEAAHQALDASGNLEPANKLAWEREAAAARNEIGAETWDKAWTAGRATSIDQALAWADLGSR